MTARMRGTQSASRRLQQMPRSSRRSASSSERRQVAATGGGRRQHSAGCRGAEPALVACPGHLLADMILWLSISRLVCHPPSAIL